MEKSKVWLKDHKILPKISFQDGKEHIVRVIDDRPETITDRNGKEVEGMKYKVVEDKTPKTIFTTSVALISKLADTKPETTVGIKQRKYSEGSEIRTTYDVLVVGETDDIPVIQDEPKKAMPTTTGGTIDPEDLPF